MSFNGSGQFQLNSGGLPYVTGTTISSTHANNLNTDLASGLSNVICKDGQTTVTANLPMSTFRHTNVGVATARTDYARASQVQDSTLLLIGSVSGTNTILGSLSPAITAYAAGQLYTFIPANTNSGATTISINSVGAVNIFAGGTALVGGELVAGIPTIIEYDGTRFHIVNSAPFGDARPLVMGTTDNTKRIRFEVDGLTTATTRVLTVQDQDMTIGLVLGTAQASTSGVTIDFSIPAWAKSIKIHFVGVSTNGISNPLIQIGDAGGIETTGYLGASAALVGAASVAAARYTAGFGLNLASAANVIHGKIEINLENADAFTWVASGGVGLSNLDATANVFGSKSLSAALTTVRITTVNGTDAFDAGEINVLYE